MEAKNGPGRRKGNRLLGTTKGKILMLLCQGRQTVSELGVKLGVTDNAVRAQLQRLERDGLVSEAGSRRGVRRPHVEYELAAKAYGLFPKAYEPVLRKLVDVLAERLSEEVVRELLVQAGRAFVDDYVGAIRGRSPRQRLAQIMSRLNGASLGIEIGQAGRKTVLQSCSCPLASVTATHPEMCEALASVLGYALRAPEGVCQRCERNGVPRCRFEIARVPQ